MFGWHATNSGLANNGGSNFRIKVDGTCFSNYATTSSWLNGSSRETKENFEGLDPQDVPNNISALEMTQWDYKNEDDSIKHIGPIAEDFYDIFGLGNNRKTISSIDPADITLVGVQALNRSISTISDEVEIIQTQHSHKLQSGDAPSFASLSVSGDVTVDQVVTVNNDADFKGSITV